MTDEEWEQIKPAVEAYETARLSLRVLGQQNEAAMNTRAAIDHEVEMKRAARALSAADKALDQRKREVLGDRI